MQIITLLSEDQWFYIFNFMYSKECIRLYGSIPFLRRAICNTHPYWIQKAKFEIEIIYGFKDFADVLLRIGFISFNAIVINLVN